MSTSAEYRKFINDTSWYTHTDEGNAPELMYLTLGLAGESGEFADAVKKIIRITGSNNDEAFKELMLEDGGEAKLIEELGDVLWYVTKLADFIGLSIDDLMHHNTYKLYNRLIELGHISREGTPWPLTDPGMTESEAAAELFNQEVFCNVRVDEKV